LGGAEGGVVDGGGDAVDEVPVQDAAFDGGEVYDRSSPHYKDLMDQYWSQNQYFDLPYTTDEIIGKAEDHIRFTVPPAGS